MRRAFPLLFILVVLLTRTARAEDVATESARLHFQIGLRLFDATPPDHAGALVEFEASYRDKKAASTRLNMAICYRALRRYPEAIDALRDVLAMPSAALTVNMQRASEHAIAEMEALVGFVHVELPPNVDPKDVTVLVDGEARPFDRRVAFRLAGGIHTIAVRVRNFAEPVAARVAVAGGKHERVTFALVPAEAGDGQIEFHGPWPEMVDIDGAPVNTNAPHGVAAGVHRISMRREGRVVWLDVSVDSGQARKVDAPSLDEPALTLARGVDAAFPERAWYVRGGPSISGELLRFGASVGEPANGTLRTLYGPAFSVAAGRNVSQHWGVELLGDVGTAWRDYALASGTASAQIDTLAVIPSMRFRTKGSARFTTALGLGVAGRSLTISRPTGPGTTTSDSAGGTTAALYLDVGADVNIGRVFIHGTLFANGFRLAPIQGTNDTRPFDGELSLRTGARLEIGFEF